jgi:hypothetical protein
VIFKQLLSESTAKKTDFGSKCGGREYQPGGAGKANALCGKYASISRVCCGFPTPNLGRSSFALQASPDKTPDGKTFLR